MIKSRARRVHVVTGLELWAFKIWCCSAHSNSRLFPRITRTEFKWENKLMMSTLVTQKQTQTITKASTMLPHWRKGVVVKSCSSFCVHLRVSQKVSQLKPSTLIYSLVESTVSSSFDSFPLYNNCKDGDFIMLPAEYCSVLKLQLWWAFQWNNLTNNMTCCESQHIFIFRYPQRAQTMPFMFH